MEVAAADILSCVASRLHCESHFPHNGIYFKSLLYSRSLAMASARFSCKVMRLR